MNGRGKSSERHRHRDRQGRRDHPARGQPEAAQVDAKPARSTSTWKISTRSR